MRLFLAGLLVFFICGCTTITRHEQVYITEVGESEATLLSAWGRPDNEYVAENGRRVMEYVRAPNVLSGGRAYAASNPTEDQGNINRSDDGSVVAGYAGPSAPWAANEVPVYRGLIGCKTTFVVNANGIIEDSRAEGNNCLAVAPNQVRRRPYYNPYIPERSKREQDRVIRDACRDWKIASDEPACN